MIQQNNVSLTPLKNAFKRFLLFSQEIKNEKDEAAVVHSFEFCYEMSWKTLKKVLAYEGIETTSPKDVFRKAGQSLLISNVEEWIFFMEKRNLSSHVYDEKVPMEIIPIINQFQTAVEQLITTLEERLNDK